jgi:glycosyltransferase involved in cell wall biosynthesis
MEMTEQNPKVSVCVVTYNQEKYINQCLQSIVDQETNFNFEVLVSDDCSTDGTRAIIQKFAEKYPGIIKPIFHKKNIGAFKNFLSTHDSAKCEYVCHVDGDDYWFPGKLQHQNDILDECENVVQCWTCAYVVDDNNKIVRTFPSKAARLLYPRNLQSEDLALSYALVGQHSTQMYRRTARDRSLIIGDVLDFYVAFIISLSGTSYYSKSIYSAYRVGANDSATRNLSKKRLTVDLLAEHLQQIADSYPIYRRFVVANLSVRSLFSYFAGHDLQTISEIRKSTKTPLRIWYAIKSAYYFLLQKIY